MEQYEEDEQVDLGPREPESAVEKLVEKTPWWAISVGAHTIAVLILSFLIVLGNPFEDADAVTMTPPRKPRQLPEMEKLRDMIKNNPLDIKKKAVEEVVFKRAKEADHTETADEEDRSPIQIRHLRELQPS